LQRQDASDVLLQPYTQMLDAYTAAARLAASGLCCLLALRPLLRAGA
jgi:hypothetical protein